MPYEHETNTYQNKEYKRKFKEHEAQPLKKYQSDRLENTSKEFSMSLKLAKWYLISEEVESFFIPMISAGMR